MKNWLTGLILLILSISLLSAQNKYKDIDLLISTKSSSDAREALQILEKIEQKDSSSAEYWLRNSQAFLIINDFTLASASIDKAIIIDPSKSEYYFQRGLVENKSGNVHVALNSIQKAINIKKEGKYYFWKGVVNQQLGNSDLAEKDYKIAIDNKFESEELYTNLAILLAVNARYQEAFSKINRAVSINPNFPQAYSTRSMLNLFLLNFDEACADKVKALRMNYSKTFNVPDMLCTDEDDNKLQIAADLFASNKLFKPAISAYTKLIEKGFKSSDNYLNRGYSYFIAGDIMNAEKDYLTALNLPNPASDQIYDNLSLLYFDQSRYQKAADFATKRIELNPENHVAYLDRGLCYRKLKKYKKSETDFDTSLTIKPDFFRAFGYRSYLNMELGNYEKAFADASKSVQLEPQYGYGYLVLGQVKEILGKLNYCDDFSKAKQFGEPDADAALLKFCK